MSQAPTYARICAEAGEVGLDCCGAFHLTAADEVPELAGGRHPATLLLLGFRGPARWPVFELSAEVQDGQPHPLDRWSRRIIGALASRHDALAVYPFSGPPWWPFQRWAMRAEGLRASPLGLLMHPKYGLWHSYRGALLFKAHLDLPAPLPAAHPCDTCAAKPCLHTCPVAAVSVDRFDAAACRDFLRSGRGSDCRDGGCLARRSCPVGAEYRQFPAQAAYHIAAFAGLPRRGDTKRKM